MKCLITQLGRIGDMILITPVIRAIKEKYPDSEIDILSGRLNHSVIDDNPGLNRIIVYEKSPLKLINTIRLIRKEKYDYYIDPKDHKSTESRMFARIARADKKIGFNAGSDKTFDFSVPSHLENDHQHYIEKCFNALEPLGIKPRAEVPRPELFTNPGSETYLGNFVSGMPDKPIIVINISASRPGKMWENSYWAEFIKTIDSDSYNVVVTFAPTEKELASDLLQMSPGINLFRSRSMNDVISLIKSCTVLVTPDTSLVHVAAAFDKPLLGLFSDNEKMYRKFYPLSRIKEVVRADKGDEGIKSILPSRLISSFRKLLDSL